MVGWSRRNSESRARRTVSTPDIDPKSGLVDDEVFVAKPDDYRSPLESPVFDDKESTEFFNKLKNENWERFVQPTRYRRARLAVLGLLRKSKLLVADIWARVTWTFGGKKRYQKRLEAQKKRMRQLAGLEPPNKPRAERINKEDDPFEEIAMIDALNQFTAANRPVREPLPKPDYVDMRYNPMLDD